MNLGNKKKKKFNRYTGLLLIMVVVFSLLINQMFNLQVIHGDEYFARANVEFIKNMDNAAPRGEIIDAKGNVLATSLQSYNLIYVDTTESRKEIYTTIDKVEALLQKSGEEINDSFSLKTDPFRFEFNSDDPDFIRSAELRWKKDRGINDYLFNTIMREKTGKSKIADLNESETNELDELILDFTPEETYYYLISFYNLYEPLEPTPEEKKDYALKDGREIHEELLKVFDWGTIRSYLLIRDSIRMESYSGSKAVTLVSNMSEASAFTFMQQLSFLPGIDVETNPIRFYPYGPMAAHVLGYLNPVPAKNKDYYLERGYDISKDYIGIQGIESAYENRLKGSKGVSTVEVDKNGRTVSELFELETYPGSTVQLTLDLDLQHTAEQALKDIIIRYSEEDTKHAIAGYFQDSSNATRGAVIAMDINTGNVLAMASYPSYDPNIFAVPGRLTTEIYKEIFTPDYKTFAEELIQEKNIRVPVEEGSNVTRPATVDDLFRTGDEGNLEDNNDLYAKPLFNYATQGLVPSGSTFKIVTGLAALEEGVITANTIIRDTGSFSNDKTGTPITNEGGGSYGNTDLAKAIAKSSNVYFSDVGYRLYQAKGLNALAEWAWKLGLGHNPEEPLHSTTGIEIRESIYGNVYNHYGKVELTKKLFMFDVVEFLKAGQARDKRKGLTFPPLDIGIDRSDVETIAIAKENIKKVIRESLDISLEEANNLLRKDYAEVRNNLTEVIHEYITLLPEEESAGLADAERYADELATLIIYDKSTEIISPRNVLNSSLGQGDNQVTLLQVTNALAAIANGGTRYKTNLVSRILDAEGNVIQENEPVILEETGITKATVDALLEGLHDSTKPGGGAYSVFKDFPIESGGKTGTATWKTNQEEFGRAAFGVYTAVAPIENPEIVVAAIVYDVTRGSFVAPISLAVLEEYFEDQLEAEFPDYQRQFDYDSPEPTTNYVEPGEEAPSNEEESVEESEEENTP